MMAAMNFTVPENQGEDHDKKSSAEQSHRRPCVSNLRVNFLSEFDEREFEAADILLNLSYFFTNSVSDFRFPYSWGATRRRSMLDDPSSPPRKKVISTPPPPTPVVNPVPKPEASSPATPLAFCPSDSEGKSKQSTKRKTSLKRTRDEWQRIIEEKTQTQHTLLKEVEKVKLHLQKLQDENSELKAKKLKLIQSTEDERREKTEVEGSEGLNPVTECPQPQLQLTAVNDCLPPGPSTSTLFQHQAPSIPHLIMNPTVQAQLHYGQPVPLGFDLNLPVEEMESQRPVRPQPLDQYQRVMLMSMAYADRARAARQYRMQRNKSKKAQRGTR